MIMLIMLMIMLNYVFSENTIRGNKKLVRNRRVLESISCGFFVIVVLLEDHTNTIFFLLQKLAYGKYLVSGVLATRKRK